MPDTGRAIGTPASIIARLPPHTDAIDEMLKNKEAELLEV